MLLKENVHPSWKDFLSDGILEQLRYIESKIGNNFTPPEELVLRFLTIDLDNVKVLILGQDPYPQPGVANGRSFQPSNLTNWTQSYRNSSIKNIIRLIYKDYVGELVKYSEIDWHRFGISPPQPWFDSLEKQGVLFLNTSFTCEVGKSDSHSFLWTNFTNKLIEYISSKRPELYWFLFGKSAQTYDSLIRQGRKIRMPHPMMGTGEFFESTCFKDTKSIISWLG